LSKIDQNFELFGYIYDCMVNKKWPPDVIAGRIKLENNLPNISTETIYNYVYNSDKARKL
jgi:IS30 family transposase